MVDKYTLTAYKTNKTIYKEGQEYLSSLVEKLDYEDNWAEGFSQASTLLDQIGRIGRNILTSDNASSAIFLEINSDTYELERIYPIDCDRVFLIQRMGQALTLKRRLQSHIFIKTGKKYL